MTKISVMAAELLTIFNPKGGVGKSGTSVNLALYASHFKLKTLLVDNDAQKNTTNTLCSKIPANALLASMLFTDGLPDGYAPIKINPYLDLIAGDKKLKNVDSMVSGDDRNGRRSLYQTFRNNVRSFEEQYDLIIIDTPTTAEHRYTSALVASNYCLAPATMEAFGMDGVQDLKEIVRNVKSQYGNPTLKDLGIMPNKVSPRSKLHARTLGQLRDANIKLLPETVYLRADIENKLDVGKRSPAMLPAVKAILTEMKLSVVKVGGAA